MVCCSVACCTNGNHYRQDQSYFAFTFDAGFKKWIKFCCRANKTGLQLKSTKAKAGKPIALRICTANFVLESYKRTLNGRRKILESALPTIFKPSEKRSPREVRYESVRKKRRLNDDIKTPTPSLRLDPNKENHPVKEAKATFIRRISAVSNAIQTIDNEANHLIIYCLNCIRHGRNATYEPGLK